MAVLSNGAHIHLETQSLAESFLYAVEDGMVCDIQGDHVCHQFLQGEAVKMRCYKSFLHDHLWCVVFRTRHPT